MVQTVNLMQNKAFIQPQKTQENQQKNINPPQTDKADFSTKQKCIDVDLGAEPNFIEKIFISIKNLISPKDPNVYSSTSGTNCRVIVKREGKAGAGSN